MGEPGAAVRAPEVLQHTSRGDERRQRLIVVAFELIAEVGFEGLRTRDVASGAGVNIATLHYYFATKEALIRAVVEYLLDLLSTPRNPPVQGTAARLHQEFVDFDLQIKESPAVYVVLAELSLRALRDPIIRAITARINDRWKGYLLDLFNDGIREGVFRKDLDAGVAAATMIALIQGATSMLLRDTDGFDLFAIAREFERGVAGGRP